MVTELSVEDVARIVRLVADASDPTVELLLPGRKRMLLEGIAELVSADMWMWNMSILNPELVGDVVATNVVDDGWQGDQEKSQVADLLSQPKFNQRFGGGSWTLFSANDFLRPGQDLAPC